jgi:hypothetical protein
VYGRLVQGSMAAQHWWSWDYGPQLFGMALRMRWFWLSRSAASRSWSMLPLQDDCLTIVFFNSFISLRFGDGQKFLFLVDLWLNGTSALVAYHQLVRVGPKCLCVARTVASALDGNTWIHIILGVLMVPVLMQFVEL